MNWVKQKTKMGKDRVRAVIPATVGKGLLPQVG